MSERTSYKIAPSILTANFGHLADEIQAAEAGGADYIHLDVMDGAFVPNISFGASMVRAVSRMTALPLDVHLMVEAPERYLTDFKDAGASILTVHVEACKHIHRTLQQITALGCKAGIAINPGTPVEVVREVLPLVDLVLVMSVNPGFGAQRFIESSTNKLRRMRHLMAELNPLAELEVDGGIDESTITDVVWSGANVLVTGSAVFNSRGTPQENIAALRAAVREI